MLFRNRNTVKAILCMIFFLVFHSIIIADLPYQVVRAEGAVNEKGYVWMEGEDAEKYGDYKVTNDAKASGAKQLKLDSTDTSKIHKADFPFSVTTSGKYVLWVLSTRGDTNYVSKYKWRMDNLPYKNVVQSNTTNEAYRTADNRAVPMFWNKIGEFYLDKDTSHSFGILADEMRSMVPQFYLHELDAVVIVPAEWSWEPYGFSRPFDKNAVKIEYAGGTVSAASIARNSGVTVTVHNKVTEPVQGSMRIYAEWSLKGQTVYRVSKATTVPLESWQPGTDYTDVITLPPIPFNASDSVYEVRTGFEGVNYMDQEPNKKVADVIVGNPVAVSRVRGEVTGLNLPSTIQRGLEWSGSAVVKLNQQVGFDTAGYLTFWKDDVLWGVKEVALPVATSTWNAGESHTVSFEVYLPDDGLPEGDYRVRFGLHQIEINPTVQAQTLLSGATDMEQTYKPLTYGNFYSKKDGKTHFWYVNQNHAMIWDGSPYVPVGGMFCSNYIINFDITKPDTNKINWDKDIAVLQTMKTNGVVDLYINSVKNGAGVPAWAWQYLTDYLDSQGFRYGIQINIGAETGTTTAYMVHANEAGGTFKVENVTVSGSVYMQIPTSLVNGYKEPKSTLFAVVDMTTGQLIQAGRGIASASSSSYFTVSANVVLPTNRAHTVFFIPQVDFTPVHLGNIWDNGATTKQRLKDFADRIEFGSNFRLFVDPVFNEEGVVNWYESMRIDSSAYQTQYVSWLTKKYGSISAVNNAWSIRPGVENYETAARLIPLSTGAAGSGWKDIMYLMDPVSGRVYSADARKGVLWDDHVNFYYTSLLEFNNDVADSLSEGADVPVVFKHTGMIKTYFINDRLYGGFDGIGGEVYGNNDNTVRMKTGWGYSEAEQSKKTTWFIITETQLDENIDRKVASGEVGYPSKEKMHSQFNSMISIGAKGIYDFLFYAPHDGRLANYYCYVPAKPIQFDWLKEYRNMLLSPARLSELVGTKPEVYYAYPPGQMWWMKPDVRTAALPGDDYRGSGVMIASNGRLVASTYDTKVDTKVLIVSLEDGPATTVWGDAIRNTALKSGTRTTVYMGLRKNLGALPEIDGYFTSETAVLANGDTIQVLKPTATSEILYSTADGKVWGLRDGNLWIIANANWISHNEYDSIKYIGDWDLEADNTPPVPSEAGNVETVNE